MQATLQFKVTLEKAQQLKSRLFELKKAAMENRSAHEKQLKKTKDEAQRAKLEELIALAKEVELDVTITNLLRAVVDFAIEKLLVAPDATLLAAIHASKANRGRPVRQAGGES